MNRAEIDQRVERGVEWLDENVPDWLDRVVVLELDLYSPCKCVLGQIFETENERAPMRYHSKNGFGYALGRYFGRNELLPFHYGFDFGISEVNLNDWWMLTEAWREKISYLKRQRRGDQVLLTRLLAESFEPLTLEEELYVLEGELV